MSGAGSRAPLIVLTGPVPPHYAVEQTPAGAWTVTEDGRAVDVGRRLGNALDAALEAGRLAAFQWKTVGTVRTWPPLEPAQLAEALRGMARARTLIIPPPPARPQLWSRN